MEENTTLSRAMGDSKRLKWQEDDNQHNLLKKSHKSLQRHSGKAGSELGATSCSSWRPLLMKTTKRTKPTVGKGRDELEF